MSYFIKVFRVMSIVSEWSVTALADGKVSIAELTQLGTDLCQALGVKTEFEIPGGNN